MKIQIRVFHYRLFIEIEITNRKAQNYPTEEQRKQSFTTKKLWDSRWKNRLQRMS